MKTNELRLGNLVRLKETGEVKVIFALGDCNLNFEHVDADTNLIEPIPLNEKWLEDFGFKRGDNRSKQNGCWVVNDSFFWIKLSASLLTINPTNGVVWIYNPVGEPFNNPKLIESVHQLQNLYFALTGEELKKQI